MHWHFATEALDCHLRGFVNAPHDNIIRCPQDRVIHDIETEQANICVNLKDIQACGLWQEHLLQKTRTINFKAILHLTLTRNGGGTSLSEIELEKNMGKRKG